MKPIEELRTEHRAIESSLSILGALCDRIEQENLLANPEHIDGLIEFFQVFVDQCHHGKEETQLFPALEAQGMPKENSPIAVMLTEHEAGRAFVRDMAVSMGQYREGNSEALMRLVHNARSYIDLLVNHIRKEDGVLFPMADQRLSEETGRRMAAEFDRIEREEVGEGRHEAFHSMLEKLGEFYARA
jgi:hemerythrin-like domain-containing protein